MKLLEKDRAKLTERQREIWRYIQERVNKDGMPPTHDEIKDELGLQSAFGIRQHLRLMAKKGHITLSPGKSRGIHLVEAAPKEIPNIVTIPIVGHIAAGAPILAEEQLEGWVAVNEDLYPKGALFALRVRGNSMIKVGINSGDLAIIRRQANVENGQIAGVQMGNEATLKRVSVSQGLVSLKSENDSVADIPIWDDPDTEIRILGLYVGLVRQAQYGRRT